ncbi:hypothetical protein MKX08_004925 [Trichoderma sp. CBMAI-0020]|nr:hypothetical protein MKX08_004925 [Trichoderma sp. CBMAI-0020]
MRPTLALRAFRPTARMMRPIPVSAAVLDEPVKKIRDPANLLAVTEGGPGRYVTPIDARRALRQPRRSVLTILSQGHTVSQRLRKLKQMPAELYPLFVVVGFALGAAAYSCSRKFFVDKNLRLSRQGAAARAAQSESHGEH